MAKALEKFNAFIQFASHKYGLDGEALAADLEEFCDVEKHELVKHGLSLYDEYKTFLDKNETRLQEAFDQKHSFQTSTRGLKVRGCFNTQDEAEMRARLLREQDPNHDVFVGPVGVWLPFNPAAYRTGRVEYLEKELNDLMREKKANANTKNCLNDG